MAQLSVTEIRTLKTLLKLDDGYLLNFTYGTLHDFFVDLNLTVETKILSRIKYQNRVGAGFMHNFMKLKFPDYDDELVGKIILKFVGYIRNETDNETLRKEDFPEELITKATNIAHRLLGKRLIKCPPKTVYSNGEVNMTLEAEVFNQEVKKLLNNGHHSKAVEEAYKIVRGKLKEITGADSATQAFEKTDPEKIFGYNPKKEDKNNFSDGTKSLHTAIQKFRNDMAHPSSKDIRENQDMDKDLALHYIALASLAYKLITSNKKGV